MNEAIVLGIWHGFALAIGLSLGSFANVAIDRMPLDRSLLTPSACDSCGTRIGPRDLVPVLSYAALKGRCRECGASIGAHVPLVELFLGLSSVALWRKLVPGVNAIDTPHVAAWAVFLVFLLLLTIAAFVDVRHRIIPNETSSYAIPVGLGSMWVLDRLGYEGWLGIDPRLAVGGALFAGGLFTFTALVARAVRGSDALGWGDVKLVAMIGSFLGAMPGAMVVMLLGSMIGSVTGIAAWIITRNRPWLPFGPALAGSAYIYVFLGYEVVDFLFPHMAGVFFGPP